MRADRSESSLRNAPRWPWLTAGLLGLALAAGCGPAVPKAELGHVVYEIPKVHGADKPYQLPVPAAVTQPIPNENAESADNPEQ